MSDSDFQVDGLETLKFPERVKEAVKRLGRKGAINAIAADCSDDECRSVVREGVSAIMSGGEVSMKKDAEGDMEIKIDEPEEGGTVTDELPVSDETDEQLLHGKLVSELQELFPEANVDMVAEWNAMDNEVLTEIIKSVNQEK